MTFLVCKYANVNKKSATRFQNQTLPFDSKPRDGYGYSNCYAIPISISFDTPFLSSYSLELLSYYVSCS